MLLRRGGGRREDESGISSNAADIPIPMRRGRLSPAPEEERTWKRGREKKDDYRGAKSFGNSWVEKVCIFHVWIGRATRNFFLARSP